MASERSKRRDLLACIFIKRSISKKLLNIYLFVYLSIFVPYFFYPPDKQVLFAGQFYKYPFVATFFNKS